MPLDNTALAIVYDNNGSRYNGNIHMGLRKRDANVIYPIGYSPINSAPDYYVGKMKRLHRNHDYYITANATNGKVRQRESLLSLNNIVIDIDCHDETIDPIDRDNAIDAFVFYFRRDLEDVPFPNIINYTGRGLQLWWHIEQCAVNLLWLYRKVGNQLKKACQFILDENPSLGALLSIDERASCSPEGYYRAFGGWNTESMTAVRTDIIHYKTYLLNMLHLVLDVSDAAGHKPSPPSPEIKLSKKGEAKTTSLNRGYTAMAVKRLAMVEFIVNNRTEHIGHRDKWAFLAYNNAVQIWGNGEKARDKVKEINNKYKNPLRDSELQIIFKYIDNVKSKKFESHGFLNFSKDTFLEWLCATNEELEVFEAMHNPRNATRDRECQERKAEKEKRHKQVTDMLALGQHTQADIAQSTGCSLSTVKRISAAAEDKPISEAQAKPWMDLGVSRATYYRQKRNEK